MKPIPGYSLWVSTALDTLLLPSDHPPGIYYHGTPLVAYQPFTPSFHKWLSALVAAAGTAPAVAESYNIRCELREYLELAFTAATIAAATPAVIIPDPSPVDLGLLLHFKTGFLRTPTFTAWTPRTP